MDSKHGSFNWIGKDEKMFVSQPGRKPDFVAGVEIQLQAIAAKN